MLDENFEGFEELTHNGTLRLYTRNGIFQARLYIGDRRYLTKSLKTRKLDKAREEAEDFWHDIRFKRKENMPIKVVPRQHQWHRFDVVI